MYADRVQETTTTTGTSTMTVGGAVSGFRTWASAFSNGERVRYGIAGGTEWEVGEGTYTSGTIQRDGQVLSSSNAGALVNFSAGTKAIYCAQPGVLIADVGLTLAMRNLMYAF